MPRHPTRLRSLQIALALLALAPAWAPAQLADKPSAFAAQRRGQVLSPTATATPSVRSLARIDSRAQFETLARVQSAGNAQEIVHTLFVIDRQRGAQITYLNANRYRFHSDYLRELQGVAPSHAALAALYRDPQRRFIFGTIGYRAELQHWTYEFWEGDQLTPALLRSADEAIARSFFAPVRYKANASDQEAVGREAGIETLTEQAILGQRSYLPLNEGRAVGRLRVITDIESDREDDIEAHDIVVLREVPLALPPVAGVITERPSTVLSHVNVLAKGWGIPNAYVRDAAAQWAHLNGQWVEFHVGPTGMRLTPHRAVAAPARRAMAPRGFRPPVLAVQGPQALAQLSQASSRYCGGKAATLGEIERRRRLGQLPGIAEVPDGFCIPHASFMQFMRQPEVQDRIAQALATPGFERSRLVRRQALEALRQDLVRLPVDPAQASAWQARWQAQLGGAGVFVRSSSNAEDLAGYSGAGLFTTVPNVTQAPALVQAVQTVWASVYNFEAVESRRHAGIGHHQVAMAVFVQKAIDPQNSGVLVTRDPFDATHRHTSAIAAKRGVGIRVVEGRRVAEQSLFDHRSGAVRRLTRSAEDSALQLNAQGGVQSTPVPDGHQVLSDAQIRALSQAGQRLKALLRRGDLDIEWAIDRQGRIVLLQARPYITRDAL